MVFTFSKGGKKKKQTQNKEYITENVCGEQSLKYLSSGPLKKRFANPRTRLLLKGAVMPGLVPIVCSSTK